LSSFAEENSAKKKPEKVHNHDLTIDRTAALSSLSDKSSMPNLAIY